MTHQVPSFLAAAMKLSVWMNGLLVPLNGSVTNLQRFCRPVMFHNDDPVFDLSCSGSSLLFRHARRNLMLCTRHQITNLERNPADIVLIVDDPDGRKSALTRMRFHERHLVCLSWRTSKTFCLSSTHRHGTAEISTLSSP